MVWLLWGSVALSISPLPAAITGIGGNVVFLVGCFLFLAYFLLRGGKLYPKKFLLALLSVGATIPAIAYWREPGLALQSIYFVFSVLVLVTLNNQSVFRFSEIATKTLLAISIGAWIGFLYAFLGGKPLFAINNPDERLNEFFLTTFSNWSIGNLIRPAGLFDEPGALSFLICLVAALRSQLNQSKKTTWLLLSLGLITTSVAHVIYMACHAAHDRRLFLMKKKYLFAAILAGVALAANVDQPDSFETEIFLSRFVVEDGKLGGDSRTDLLTSALEKIDLRVFFFGLDSDCVLRPALCTMKGYGPFGETPAGIILLLGIFLSMPYFFVLIATLYIAIGRQGFVFIGIFLLLLQRPYVLTFGYSLLILIVVFGVRASRSIRHTARAQAPPRTGLQASTNATCI